jgi:hypothetical protein
MSDQPCVTHGIRRCTICLASLTGGSASEPGSASAGKDDQDSVDGGVS